MDAREKCPNPNGEEGICYAFDRYGDRCGCVNCELLETLPNGIFNEGNPLPGLSKKSKPKSARELFEKLGFKLKLENIYVITYKKEDVFGDIEIGFNKEHNFVSLETLEHNSCVIKKWCRYVYATL